MRPKLVRDKIPQIIRASGETPIVHVAGDVEYREALQDKLREEVAEALAHPQSSEELADVVEAVHAMAAELGVTPAELEVIRQAKRQARGGFEGRIIWSGNKNER